MGEVENQITDKTITFRPDNGLMFLIQSVTKQNSADILGFFFDFGKAVLMEGVNGMLKQYSIRKEIRDFYPGTAIPFQMLVTASRSQYRVGPVKTGCIEISFPNSSSYIDTEKLIEIIAERELLGGSGLPDFEPPKNRTPAMYKDLIAEVLKDGGKTVQCSGYSRETGSSGTALARADDETQS